MSEVVTGSVKLVTVGVLTLAVGRETVETAVGAKSEADSLLDDVTIDDDDVVGDDVVSDLVGNVGVTSPVVSPITSAAKS